MFTYLYNLSAWKIQHQNHIIQHTFLHIASQLCHLEASCHVLHRLPCLHQLYCSPSSFSHWPCSLHYDSNSCFSGPNWEHEYIFHMDTYLLYIVLVIMQICLESDLLHKVWPSLTETWIIFIAWDCMASQAKVCIKSDEKRINISVQCQPELRPKPKVTYLTDNETLVFFPGCGHAGHSTAHSPALGFKMPVGSCPHPDRLSILRWRHWWTILKNCS